MFLRDVYFLLCNKRCAHVGILGFGFVELEDHEVLVVLGEGLPFAILSTVRIAELAEVAPGGEHLLREVAVALGPRAPAMLQRLEHIPEVAGVEGTLQTL